MSDVPSSSSLLGRSRAIITDLAKRVVVDPTRCALSWLAELKFIYLWIDAISRTVTFGMLIWVQCWIIHAQFYMMNYSGQGAKIAFAPNKSASLIADVCVPDELHDATVANKARAKRGEPVLPVKKKFPVLILFSGGAWLIASRKWMRPLLVSFCDAGFITTTPHYRQFPWASMPEMVDDVLDALLWVFEEIGRPGSLFEHGDPDQVICLGQSAGAHVCSLALLKLAKLRKEQLALVAQGIAASDRSFLHTQCRGVPLAFVGVSGMFDLVSCQEQLHSKGLHRRVLNFMCNNEPIERHCARSRGEMAAAEVRETLLNALSAVDESAMLSRDSSVSSIVHRRHRSSRSGEICEPTATTQASSSSGSLTSSGSGSTNAKPDDSSSSSAHFLPRFSLFVHGEKDQAAPILQARDFCAVYNDIAARHADELVGPDIEWTKRAVSSDMSCTASDPFVVLVPKACPTSPLAVARSASSGSFVAPAAIATAPSAFASRNPDGSSMGERSNSNGNSNAFDCECYQGNRSMFLSYPGSTHTSLIVGDFFRRDRNTPLVIGVLALLKSLNELAADTAPSATTTATAVGHKRVTSTMSNLSATSGSAQPPMTPVRVAPQSQTIVERFEKNYAALDKKLFRNPKRPTVPYPLLWAAEKISAF